MKKQVLKSSRLKHQELSIAGKPQLLARVKVIANPSWRRGILMTLILRMQFILQY